uniref:MICOS complex subunit MIC19 n=1 Tax=Candidozyma auris TaxID=498019 RepID=A0A0L0P4P4_CANAR
MGSTTSKPETKVFTPNAPVDFSASFLSHLENSQESDYTRAQYTEKYIQERVASELSKLEAEAQQKFKDATNNALEKSKDAKVSVAQSNEKVQLLTKALQESAKLIQVEVSEDIKKARSEVIACLKQNQGRSLNCWDEVEQFKTLVNSM